MSLPAGPRLAPPLQTLGWIARPVPFLRRAHARYGDVFTLRMATGERWVVLAHPDHVREVFTGPADLLRAGEANRILLPVVGRHSVLLLDGPEHLRQRRLLLPPFHGERMQGYRDAMVEATEREVATWAPGEVVRLAPAMQRITLEVILRTVFGVADGGEVERLRRLLLELLEFTVAPRRLVLLALLGGERLKDLPSLRRVLAPVDAALLDEIARRRAAPDLDEREDVLSLLLRARDEDGAGLSDAELRDELVTLLVAGHETTATALGWAFERLLRHPAAVARATAEPEYADAVVTETLRLRPVLALVVRRLREPMTIAGHDLPAGSEVAPCIYLVHRRPDLYPDPDAFRPERWLGAAKPGTYTWLPFGGGIRRCLGASFALMEMQTVLRTVLATARLRPVDGASELTARRAITLVPARGAAAVPAAA
jgi:cytochrome P450